MTARRLLAAALLLSACAVGCGIRPTAVPVDAGAPASRTACPSPVQVPSAVPAAPLPTTSPAVSAPGNAFSAAPSPTVVPSAPPTPPCG